MRHINTGNGQKIKKKRENKVKKEQEPKNSRMNELQEWKDREKEPAQIEIQKGERTNRGLDTEKRTLQ